MNWSRCKSCDNGQRNAGQQKRSNESLVRNDQDPDQMSDYISRLKFKLDEGWRIESTRAESLKEGRQEGREEGLKEGELKGELIGQIVILQELLGLTDPGRDDLSTYDAIQLKDLCSQRRQQLRSRQSS